jgi:hypothetical protein
MRRLVVAFAAVALAAGCDRLPGAAEKPVDTTITPPVAEAVPLPQEPAPPAEATPVPADVAPTAVAETPVEPAVDTPALVPTRPKPPKPRLVAERDDRRAGPPAWLMARWRQLDATCRRGADDDIEAAKACDRRDLTLNEIMQRGWCRGDGGWTSC